MSALKILEELYPNRAPIQLGFAVKDSRAAAEVWAKMVGAGPFGASGKKQEYLKTFVYGREEPINHASGCGQWGSLQIELYQPLDSGLAANIIPPADGMGVLHHINMGFVESVEAEKERMAKLGIIPALEFWCTVPEGAKAVIFDTRHICGVMLEVYEENAGMRYAYKFQEHMAEIWDRKSYLITEEMAKSFYTGQK